MISKVGMFEILIFSEIEKDTINNFMFYWIYCLKVSAEINQFKTKLKTIIRIMFLFYKIQLTN